MTRSQAVAALRGDHLQQVSSSATRYLRCTSHRIDLQSAPWQVGGRAASSRLPAYRLSFTDPRLPGDFRLQIAVLPDAAAAAVCAEGGIFEIRHMRLGGVHDSPTPAVWPSRRIDAATVYTGNLPGPGGYWIILARGRVLAIGNTRTRLGASVAEHDLASAAAQLSG